MTAQEFLSRLGTVSRTASGWQAKCPAHDDGKASLSISEGQDHRTLLHCHAGCSPESVAGALGLKLADLFNGNGAPKQKRGEIVATYDYEGLDGKLLFQVVRFAPKDFRQRRPDGKGGWAWNLQGVEKVLFRLPEITRDIQRGLPVIVCEGEKDVLALVKQGFSATSNAGGAGKWLNSYSDTLRGADVVIVPDKDEPGRKHAHLVAGKLTGIAKRVRVFELPDVGQPVKDAADYFNAGAQAADLIALIDASPDWTPPRDTLRNEHLPDAPADAAAADKLTAWIRGEIVRLLLDENTEASQKRPLIANAVVEALTKLGRFYFHAEMRDFDSAMFFDAQRKRLERIRSDAFSAWLSEWLVVNRADTLFKFILAAVETAALSGKQTTGILPESFWAARRGVLYLSSGDGEAVKITAHAVKLVDNGTDGVLFSAGRTLAPWKLTEPRDPFETCSLFRNAHCSATHGPDLLRLWLYSFATMPKSKPPLGAVGEIGSGKTRTLKGVAELYGIPFRAGKVEEQLEPNFWPSVNEGGLFVLDNADSKCRWLADSVAAAATDGCSQRRKLYTNSENVTLRANAWLAITSANPTFGNDAGLADRLLVVRMARKDEETSDNALTDEILANRDAGLSHIAFTLSKALADSALVPPRLNERHPDFATFAVRIGRALGRETEAISALQSAEADKSAFCLENDAIGAALLAYLREARTFTGTAAELAPHLIAVDADLTDRLSAKRLGKRLAALWPHLHKSLATAHKETDRKGFNVFTLKCNPADFAEFQTVFS